MSEPRLEHKTFKIKQLIEDYRLGKIVIPEFQRDYVWKKNKAPKLVDSLYRGFPVSSLLLWQSIEETRARRLDPRPKKSSMMDWLIDGQQRVITLARTITGDQGIDVVFNPDEDEFRLANAATKNDPGWVRVADLWDDEHWRNIRRGFTDGSRSSLKREASFERVRRVLDYEIPLVRMVDHSFRDAVKAFTRINTLGVKLKKEDIESASIAARHSGFIADEVTPFLQKLRVQGFNRINIMHLFRACAYVAKPDGRNRTPLHELQKQEVLSAWKKTERATEQAIGLIRSELGLVNMDVLWSGSLIVPIIALCASTLPRDRDSKEFVGWLALATLLHRYSVSSETALDQDLKACREADLVHMTLDRALRSVEASGGLATATNQQIEAAVTSAATDVARVWETERPVPPRVIWRRTLDDARELSRCALMFGDDVLLGARAYGEVPFGGALPKSDLPAPWDATTSVEIPGAGFQIDGYIDRLDVAGDGRRALVRDYKTGRKPKDSIILDGGKELQRCLYAFAVKALLGDDVEISASLLYLRDGVDLRLSDPDTTLIEVAAHLHAARANLLSGGGVIGIDTGGTYDDFAFALPANASATYCKRKIAAATVRLGAAAQVWEAQ